MRNARLMNKLMNSSEHGPLASMFIFNAIHAAAESTISAGVEALPKDSLVAPQAWVAVAKELKDKLEKDLGIGSAKSEMVSLDQFLSIQQITLAHDIWKTDRANFHERVYKEIIGPNMAEINAKLGQANDPHYLTYAAEFVFTEMDKANG